MGLYQQDGTRITKATFPAGPLDDPPLRVTEDVYISEPYGRGDGRPEGSKRFKLYPEGTIVSSSVVDRFFVEAKVSRISPDNGPEGGGTTVTVTGAHLDGVSHVAFDGASGTDLRIRSAGELTVRTPPGKAGAVAVSLSDDRGTVTKADGFTYLATRASIVNISPDNGPADGGTTVTIKGKYLDGTSAVTFGGMAGTNLKGKSANELTVRTPEGEPGPVDITITDDGGNVTKTNAFTYRAVPATISSISPDSGPEAGGTKVTITGSHLDEVTSVTFDGEAGTEFKVRSASELTVKTPPGSVGSVTVALVGDTEASTAEGFTYVADESSDGDSSA